MSRLKSFNPFTPKTDQYQISPTALTRNITSHSMENVAFHGLFRWWLYYQFSLHHLHIFSLRGWKNELFELGSERVNVWPILGTYQLRAASEHVASVLGFLFTYSVSPWPVSGRRWSIFSDHRRLALIWASTAKSGSHSSSDRPYAWRYTLNVARQGVA